MDHFSERRRAFLQQSVLDFFVGEAKGWQAKEDLSFLKELTWSRIHSCLKKQ